MMLQPINNQNNQNINNNPPPSSTRKHIPFRVTTSNVQGLTSPAKQLQVLDFMDLNQIQMLGISETNLSKNLPSISIIYS